MSSIPPEVQGQVKSFLNKEGKPSEIKSFRSASGGCINNGGTLVTSDANYFLKWNNANKYPSMFKVEADGLKLLRDNCSLTIPQPISVNQGSSYTWILMENIDEQGRASGFWKKFGQGLADLHRNTHEKYGLDHDNYIGALNQKNEMLDNWVEFMITNRFQPLVRMGYDEGKIDKNTLEDFDKLYGKLRGLLVSEPPSLLHGDLWSGNFISDSDGNPCMIDPAVYYGNREIEIAFTTLFGGFSSEFYNTYNEAWPMQDGYKERFDLYNIYPLLVHVNLFGGGYLSQMKSHLSQFI